MAPYCYRCPFNTQPERADARSYRRSRWECVAQVEARFASGKKQGRPVTALVVEPLIQGAAGMIPQPSGWLRQVADIARAHRVAAQLKAGTVWINTYNNYDPAAAFGGYKMSGYGRELSLHAMELYTQIKSIWVNLKDS